MGVRRDRSMCIRCASVLSTFCSCIFLNLRHLHSFPTRRSSDLLRLALAFSVNYAFCGQTISAYDVHAGALLLRYRQCSWTLFCEVSFSEWLECIFPRI